MATPNAESDGPEPVWRERAVTRNLQAARSRAEQRVQRYLDAAFALIDEKGTTEFTIQEVVARSRQSLRGFSVGSHRSSDCAPSRSACTSGATPQRSPA